MACTSRYAEAWEYVLFWCYTDVLFGTHTGAGPVDADLASAYQEFTGNVIPNTGMILYNVTQNTSGPVTAVPTNTSLTATGVTWNAADLFRIALIDTNTIALLDHILDITAGNIHAALGSVGACDCTLADWATTELKKVNIIEAGFFDSCPCNASPAPGRESLRTFVGEILTAIRTGEIEVCAGHTGKAWPARTWAEQSLSEFNAARVITNYDLRNQ